jgi:WD40 repeat protein
VRITPDGRHAVSLDKMLRGCEWDLESGQNLRTLEGLTDDAVKSVAVTPNGCVAISASAWKAIGVWSILSR